MDLTTAGSDTVRSSFSILHVNAARVNGTRPYQTGSSAQGLFLALTMYPNVQRKAQQQIDEVVGSGRLPAFEDLENLPYVKAIIKEVTRWHTAVPLGGLISTSSSVSLI